MSTARNPSSTKTAITVLCVGDAEKHWEMMQVGLLKLQHAIRNTQMELGTYWEQKNTPCEEETPISLLAEDFNDFKNALNQAIRAFNEFNKNFRFQLALLGNEHDFVKTLGQAKQDINTLKKAYEKDKSLYVGVLLPTANPTPNTTTPVEETKPETSKADLPDRRLSR